MRARLAATAVSLLFLLSPLEALAQADIIETEGLVESYVMQKGSWERVAKTPLPLQDGDRVRTGLSSSAKIKFLDGSRIDLGPNSAYKLMSARRDKVDMILDAGAIHAWIKKALSRRFTVRTPAAVCAVRGTEFLVEVNERKETNLEVYEGLLSVKTVLGEEVEVGQGRERQSLRVFPDRPIEGPGQRREPDKKESKKADSRNTGSAAVGDDGFKHDVENEVALGLSKDAVQAAAAVEARRAEYQEGKTLVDVFGKRVRLDEYVVRPAADQFKLVVLNERSERFDYFYYQAKFNQDLPSNLATALRYLNGKTGTAPEWFITDFETGRSNTQDTILEVGTGGHLVSAALAADKTVYDPDSNSFKTVSAGTAFWSTLFNNYTYKINGTEKFGWQPKTGVANITGYDYTATGFDTRILGATCTTQACETAARPSTITQPDGEESLHERVTISYTANGSSEVYDFYVADDDGRLATASDFGGATSGAAYKDALLKFNYQQTITATEFGGRKIDLVVEPKILIKSGVIQ